MQVRQRCNPNHGKTSKHSRTSQRRRNRATVSFFDRYSGTLSMANHRVASEGEMEWTESSAVDERVTRSASRPPERMGIPQRIGVQNQSSPSGPHQRGRSRTGAVEKKIVQRQEKLEAQYRKAVRVWTMDEHRVGLKPTLARQWFPW